MEARGYLNLGEAGRAAALYRQVLGCELSPRNRASYGAGLADALVKQGARQDAVATAMDVLPSLEGGVTSMRCLNRLRLVRQAAGNAAGAQEFCARFDAAERALVASCNLPGDDAPGTRPDVPALHARDGVGVRLRSCGSRQAAGSRHCPQTPLVTTGLTAVRALLDRTEEGSPGLRPDGQPATVRILRVPYQAGGPALGDFESLPPVLRLDLRHGLVSVVSCAGVIGSPSLACGSFRRIRLGREPG